MIVHQRFLGVVLSVLGVLGGWVAALSAPVDVSQALTYRDTAGFLLRYRLIPPPDLPAHPGTRYPLVVSLHGAGLDGTDNIRQLECIVPAFLAPEVRAAHPCFILAPQCPPHSYWISQHGSRYPAAPTLVMRATIALIPTLSRTYAIDPARVYVVGYSAGGAGAWDLLIRRPELFAAAVLLSAVGDPKQAKRLRGLPLWIFHGAKDRMTGVSQARAMVQALRHAGNNPRYTEYANGGHEVGWTALMEPTLYPWLFQQHK